MFDSSLRPRSWLVGPIDTAESRSVTLTVMGKESNGGYLLPIESDSGPAVFVRRRSAGRYPWERKCHEGVVSSFFLFCFLCHWVWPSIGCRPRDAAAQQQQRRREKKREEKKRIKKRLNEPTRLRRQQGTTKTTLDEDETSPARH